MFRNEVCLFLIDFAACCDSVSHAEVHDTRSEHNEEREAFASQGGPIILVQASITLNMKLVWWKMCG